MMLGEALLGSARPPVVLSWGMGVESTAILLRALEEPEAVDFALSDLVVIVAMTGDEWQETRTLGEEHILPRLRRAGVRLIQVARAGPLMEDGVVVLSDSRSPTRLHTEGRFRLSDELRTAGTVPQFAQGRRLCSIKFKGVPLDTLLEHLFGPRPVGTPAPGMLQPETILRRMNKRTREKLARVAHTPAQPFRHLMGFNAEEEPRVKRDKSYSTEERLSEYLLLSWGWTRAHCEDYLLSLLGVRWPKSCCEFCPFSGGKEYCLSRFREKPEAALRALAIEFTSMALNPRSMLYSSKPLRRALEQDGQAALVARSDFDLRAKPWRVYQVRRVYHSKGRADRWVAAVATGSAGAMEGWIRERATEAKVQVEEGGGYVRLYLRRRGDNYPATEEMLVAAPEGVDDKSRKGFDASWKSATSGTATPPAPEAKRRPRAPSNQLNLWGTA